MMNIYIIANSSQLLPAASQWIDKAAVNILKEIGNNPNKKFQVIGYTASVPAGPDSNVLSLQRAERVVDELSKRGIAKNHLQAIGGGETNKWGNNNDEKGRFPNRRIVIKAVE